MIDILYTKIHSEQALKNPCFMLVQWDNVEDFFVKLLPPIPSLTIFAARLCIQ